MSLIEMVTVFSVLAMLMSFGVVLIGLLLRSDTAGHEAVAFQLSIERLARQFRADAHLAHSAALQGDHGHALQLELNNNSHVLWTVSGPVVQRELQRDDSRVTYEAYRVPEGETVLSVDAAGGCIQLHRRQPFASLTDDTTDARPKPQLELQIVAALGIGLVKTPDAAIVEPPAGDAN
ncbi:MAG: hypothetical protein JNG89_07070 [Planctomycetaceae bacterium]|nr:hypothetical protein [Planctomycetaceae bacterium]